LQNNPKTQNRKTSNPQIPKTVFVVERNLFRLGNRSPLNGFALREMPNKYSLPSVYPAGAANTIRATAVNRCLRRRAERRR
jgi:hypothetical protein